MTLRALLEAIRSGKREFRPTAEPVDIEAFQGIAKVFVFAAEQGYLDKPVWHQESQSGHSWYDLVVATNGLSFKGEQFLASPEPQVALQQEEIIEIRPNICGLGLNLRALWRSLQKKCLRREQ